MLNITVKTLDSRNYQFEAQDDWTVANFKEHIQDTVNINSNEQRLIFCGRVLQNDKKLTEYDCNGKVIHLVRRPPPTIGNPDQDAPGADSNNNSTDSRARNFADENNVLFSALTLSPDGNINQILRQMMSLQQMMYSRTFSGQAYLGIDIEPAQDVARRLNNAARLLRITSRFVAECNTRLSQLRREDRFRPEGSSRDTPTSMMASASSHTDLEGSAAMHTGTSDQDQQWSASISSDDSRISPTSGAPRRQTRQSLTTDDIPRTNRTVAVESRVGEGATTNESNIRRYLQIMNAAMDVQHQAQALISRYLELVGIADRGWPIPTHTDAAASDRRSSHQDGNDRRGLESGGNVPSLVGEGSLLRTYVPRLLHHIGHLQHALSDLQLDQHLRTLSVALNRLPTGARQATPQQTPSAELLEGSRPGHYTGSESSTDSNQTLEGSLTITATTVGTSPIVSTTSTANLRPQASATIVLTSEPNPTGIHIPVSIPLRTHDTINIDIPLNHIHANVQTNANQQQQQQRSSSSEGHSEHAHANSDRSTASDSTQTNSRPIGLISGRFPLPFDNYLTCFSPHANHSQTLVTSVAQAPVSIHSRPLAVRRPQTTSASTSTTNSASTPNRTQATTLNPLIDSGLTEVVNNIVNSIFRQPQTQQEVTSDRPLTQGAQTSQDPMVNFMPAINIASQILGNVFGMSGNTAQDSTGRDSAQRQASASGHTMMDIDIDDGSSSHSESRYQDASENTVQASTVTPVSAPSSSHHYNPNSEQNQAPVSNFRYGRDQLLQVMQNHPDWIPIIEADISLMERYNSSTLERPPYFSDAYLSSIPRKRRRLLSATPERVLILQPSPSQAIANLLHRAVSSFNNNQGEVFDSVFNTIANDTDLQRAYEDYIKTAVEARLQSDYDYCPERFENSSKYFK